MAPGIGMAVDTGDGIVWGTLSNFYSNTVAHTLQRLVSSAKQIPGATKLQILIQPSPSLLSRYGRADDLQVPTQRRAVPTPAGHPHDY